MECLLCKMWSRLPYLKKPTTPISVQETEGIMVIGYWAAINNQYQDYKICERHTTALRKLDEFEIERTQKEDTKADHPVPTVPTPQIPTPQIHIAPGPYTNPLYVPFVQPVTPPPPPEVFKIGPGPLTNGNSTTAQPPLPVECDPAAPYRNKIQPGTIESALEAAKMPPTEGGKISFTCGLCGAQVVTGEVHAC